MYLGANHVTIGQQLVGEDITFNHIDSTTPDYDDDISEPTITNPVIRSQISDVSSDDRKILDPTYDTNSIIVLRIPKGSQINVEDYFVYQNLKYTVVQKQNDLNYLKLFCKNEQRIS